MNFLAYDSWFMVKSRKLVDWFLLGFLWIIASIPLITFGAATTAMFFTADKSILRDQEKLFSTFWKCFCKEFTQSTILWIITIVLITLIVLNGYLLFASEMSIFLQVGLIIVLLLVICWIHLWFWYLSKFEDTVKVLLANTFRILIQRLPLAIGLSILSAVTIIGAIVLLFYATPFILLIPGGYSLVACIFLRKIFVDFMP